jgi:hypothetical protein
MVMLPPVLGIARKTYHKKPWAMPHFLRMQTATAAAATVPAAEATTVDAAIPNSRAHSPAGLRFPKTCLRCQKV